MSLYRTNSDRGLWKKYRTDQPKHFHKPCYIGNKEQERTQVTYSQLQLGDDDGFHRVLNSRNSNFSYYKNASKSAPATPRATTPTRQRNKYRMMEEVNGSSGARPVNGTASALENGLPNGGHQRPVTSNSVYSQDVDENASSWDSRSLGRDSALGPYMSAYREPQRHAEDFFADRPNPFMQGSNIANEADNVVQMFLMSMNHRQNFSPGNDEPAMDEQQTNNKTVLAQMRKDFFTEPPKEESIPAQSKVTNKYLKPENRYVPAPPIPSKTDDQVVQGFIAPQMHHAEVVHVRQDSTSTEASMEASFDTQVPNQEGEEIVKSKKGFLKSLFNKKSSKKASPSFHQEDFEPEVYPDNVDYDLPPVTAAPLERKRSMSKPTDLDEILRLQEEEEQRNVNHIFANDPFFNQSSVQPALPKRSPNPPFPSELNTSFTTEPVYENRIDLNTTQEIDIDAALGYCDEEAIDNIDWPKAEEEAPTELKLDYAPPAQNKTKRSFFSFGTKKKKQQASAEVSYYVDEEDSPALDPLPLDQVEQDYKEKKGGFFKFKNKSKDKKVKETWDDPGAPLELENNQDHNQETKPSFFKFKSKSGKKQEILEDSPPGMVLDDQEVAELPVQDETAMLPRQVPVHVENEPRPDFSTVDDTLITKEEPVTIEAEHEQPLENKHAIKEKSRSKSPFFNFKGKSKPKEEANKAAYENVRQVPIDMEEVANDLQEEINKTIESMEEPLPKPSFFNFKSKSKTRQVPIQVEPKADPQDSPQIFENEHVDDECGETKPSEATEEVEIVQSTTEVQENEETEDNNEELGPIKEEQPSFSRPPSTNQERSSSKQAKRKGLSGLFKSRKSPQQTLPKQIGTMQPVDVSHLVDEDEAKVEEPPIEEEQSPAQPMDRSRTRRKSGGLSNFFANRPSSQTRDNNFTRNDRRSRSLPRNSKRDLQEQPAPPPQQPLNRPNSRPQQRPPPKSKSMGGFFNLQPKHPRRPQVPPPAPPPTETAVCEPSAEAEPTQQVNETNSSRAASRAGSMSSLASGKRRETKGLSNFLGTSPLRKSNRMPRSQTFPKVPQPNGQTHPISQPSPQPDKPQHEDVDKIEVASIQPTPAVAEASNEPTQNQELPPRAPQGRVMGRRSGRFRKNTSGELNNSSQLPKGPHTVPRPEAGDEAHNESKSDPTEQSVARDLFAQAMVHKPVTATGKTETKAGTGQPFPYADNEYDQAVNKVNRNDSYRRAGQVRNYNSLPRLGNRQKDQRAEAQQAEAVQGGADPETRSLDGRRRRHQRPSNDNCQMM